MNIVKGRYTPLSSNLSPQLRTLCANMLHQEPSQRPSVNDILAMPFLACRIGHLLPTQLIMEEFSHTVLHNKNNNKPQQNPYDVKKAAKNPYEERGQPPISKPAAIPADHGQAVEYYPRPAPSPQQPSPRRWPSLH